MYATNADQLGWLTGGQLIGIYGSPLDRRVVAKKVLRQLQPG